MEKIQLHLYKYEDSQFKQIAIIDNYQEYSFEHNLYQAGQFTVTINFNIPNAKLFERGLFIKFGEDKYCFGEILTISDTVGSNGKGSQIRNITGFDIRYLLKRRVIKNMNNGGNWVMTDKGEICLRNLINDQCGANAENKRKLPIINTIPLPANAIGKEYSVSEEFSNLYEVCKTIATQSEFGWHIKFENGLLTLECFEGNDLRNSVFFSPDFDSLASGNLSDSNNSFSNAIYVAGKGQNEERDLYEGETVENDVTPEGVNRFESFDNQSQMTTEDEYKAEAFSMLAQYGQTLEMTGQGLIKCPYVFKEQYNIGDKITLSFNNKKSVVQILSVTERSVKGTYSLNFNFGKPENTLKDQLQIILRKLQMASNKVSAVDCVKWYTIPTDSEMNKADVTFNTIGFTGNNSNRDFTFTLYTDNEKTGSKNYMVYIKNLIGTGKLILTSGKQDAQNLSLLGGTYIANIFVDEDGNVKLNSATPTTVIEANNPMPATSGAVYEAIQQGGGTTVKPNPELKGDEEELTSIQIGTEKFAIGIDNLRDIIVKNSGPIGELKYFPEKKYQYGYMFADGSVFLPEVYPDFFEFWKIHFEKECGYDNNGYPRLPDFRKMFIRGNDGTRSAYEKERESAPNLKGFLYGGTGGNDEILFRYIRRDYFEKTPGGHYTIYQDKRDFDASRYSRTYGRRNEVAPANVSQYIYIKVI